MIDSYSVAGKLLRRGDAPVEVAEKAVDARATKLAESGRIKIVKSPKKGFVQISVA